MLKSLKIHLSESNSTGLYQAWLVMGKIIVFE